MSAFHPIAIAVVLSLKITATALVLLLPSGLLLAWWLSSSRRIPGQTLLETLLKLPLVLPPTVVGYALLLLFGRGTPFGRFVHDTLRIQLLFTWEGAAVAAAVMAFPLFVRTATAAFGSVDRDLLEAARTLGATEFQTLWSVSVPLSARGLLAGVTLAVARALGEFGATLMVAGSIPGETQTLPLALYAAVQEGDEREAVLYAGVLFALAFLLLWMVGWLDRTAIISPPRKRP